MYYYDARYYDPKIGRFSSPDPIRNYRNPYSYCRNNPIALTDPTGMLTPPPPPPPPQARGRSRWDVLLEGYGWTQYAQDPITGRVYAMQATGDLGRPAKYSKQKKGGATGENESKEQISKKETRELREELEKAYEEGGVSYRVYKEAKEALSEGKVYYYEGKDYGEYSRDTGEIGISKEELRQAGEYGDYAFVAGVLVHEAAHHAYAGTTDWYIAGWRATMRYYDTYDPYSFNEYGFAGSYPPYRSPAMFEMRSHWRDWLQLRREGTAQDIYDFYWSLERYGG